MLFSSSVFLFAFLPIVLLFYYGFFRGNRPAQNGMLLLSSLFFYAWGEPWFVLVMMGSILLNYGLGLWANLRLRRKKPVRLPVICALFSNLGLLFVFKYLVFVLESLNLLGAQLMVPVIRLPIGISFFTFQALSYVLDVAWGHTAVQRRLWGVALYISFFPQLIAGPIVTYGTVALQLEGRRESWADFSTGLCRFVFGLGKKILIANQLALVADRAFDTFGGNLAAPMAWLGSVCYTLQIYYDFSGYSDMAIGLGKMFGFHFLENFRYPYAASSITEFWRRWHISLSTWFRDYVYIPLGGSQSGSREKTVRNLFVVWLFTGIWHGANWTFLCWGLFYFLLIYAEKFLFPPVHPPKWVGHLYTLLMVNFAWVIFRAASLPAAFSFLSAMFRITPDPEQTTVVLLYLRENWAVLAAALVFSFPAAKVMGRTLSELRPDGRSLAPLMNTGYTLLVAAIFLASVSLLVKGTYNPFIYFNF